MRLLQLYAVILLIPAKVRADWNAQLRNIANRYISWATGMGNPTPLMQPVTNAPDTISMEDYHRQILRWRQEQEYKQKRPTQQSAPVRQYTHIVRVEPPRSPNLSQQLRYQAAMAPTVPHVTNYSQENYPQPISHSQIHPTLISTPRQKYIISDDMEEVRVTAAKKHKFGGARYPQMQMTMSCHFGVCGGSCCQAPPMQTMHATTLPGSPSPPHPLFLVVHPSPPSQCSPECQPACLPQCTVRLQYHMPEMYPMQPMCRTDCMPSCTVDCLVMPPPVVRCSAFPCRCGGGYHQCSPFTCCNSLLSLASKMRSNTINETSSSTTITPVQIPFHTGEMRHEKETTTSTQSTTTTTTSTTTMTPTTTTTTTPSTTTTTMLSTTTELIPAVSPIYPDPIETSPVPVIPLYEMWQLKNRESAEAAVIHSNSFVEMLSELAQVKDKEDVDIYSGTDFLKYLTETGK